MERKRKIKILAIICLSVMLLALTIAFASMSEILNITGTANLDPALWQIRIEPAYTDNIENNLEVSDGVIVDNFPTFDGASIKDFKVSLSKPGDYAIFHYKLTNRGDLEAKLEDTFLYKPVCTSIVGNEDDADLVCKNLVVADCLSEDGGTSGPFYKENLNEMKIYPEEEYSSCLIITYDENATELPEDDVEISNIGEEFIFVQAD